MMLDQHRNEGWDYVGRMERRQQQQQKRSRKSLWNPLRFNRLGAKLLGVGILLFLISLLIVNIFIWKSDVSKLEKTVPQPTIIYDQNGEIASKISNSKIEGVRINQIPNEVKMLLYQQRINVFINIMD